MQLFSRNILVVIFIFITLSKGFSQVNPKYFSAFFLPKEYNLRGNIKRISIYEKVFEKHKVDKDTITYKLTNEYELDKDGKIVYQKYHSGKYNTINYYSDQNIFVGMSLSQNRKDTSYSFFKTDKYQRLINQLSFDSYKLHDLKIYEYQNDGECTHTQYGYDSTLTQKLKIVYDRNGNEVETRTLPLDEFDNSFWS